MALFNKKRVFFADEKAFYLDSPVSWQNTRVWASNITEVSAEWLLIHRCESLAVRYGLSWGLLRGKGEATLCTFSDQNNAGYDSQDLLPLLLDDCQYLLQNAVVFQQDGAPAYTAKQMQEGLGTNTAEFISKTIGLLTPRISIHSTTASGA